MVFLQVTKNTAKQLEAYIANKRNKVFVLMYLEGCGPCNETRPEWNKLQNVLPKTLLHRQDVIIASIESELISQVRGLSEPTAFPTIRYISDGGKHSQNFEDSSAPGKKERDIDSFLTWITYHAGRGTNRFTRSRGGGTRRRRRQRHRSYKRAS